MVMKALNNYLIEQLLSLDESELDQFIKGLKPETREYLDIILEKAQGDVKGVKKFFDAK